MDKQDYSSYKIIGILTYNLIDYNKKNDIKPNNYSNFSLKSIQNAIQTKFSRYICNGFYLVKDLYIKVPIKQKQEKVFMIPFDSNIGRWCAEVCLKNKIPYILVKKEPLIQDFMSPIIKKKNKEKIIIKPHRRLCSKKIKILEKNAMLVCDISDYSDDLFITSTHSRNSFILKNSDHTLFIGSEKKYRQYRYLYPEHLIEPLLY